MVCLLQQAVLDVAVQKEIEEAEQRKAEEKARIAQARKEAEEKIRQEKLVSKSKSKSKIKMVVQRWRSLMSCLCVFLPSPFLPPSGKATAATGRPGAGCSPGKATGRREAAARGGDETSERGASEELAAGVD